jgi:hypothetical protein
VTPKIPLNLFGMPFGLAGLGDSRSRAAVAISGGA